MGSDDGRRWYDDQRCGQGNDRGQHEAESQRVGDGFGGSDDSGECVRGSALLEADCATSAISSGCHEKRRVDKQAPSTSPSLDITLFRFPSSHSLGSMYYPNPFTLRIPTFFHVLPEREHCNEHS
jgi:hypothetical protein